MAQFTMTLSDVIDSDEVIFYDTGENAYPIFDEAYRPMLNKKILDHYMMWEIGQETVNLFRFVLNRKMREIMPLYNQLYESQLIAIDPLQTHKMTSVGETTGEQSATTHSTASTDTETSSTTDNTSASRAVTSDFPQQMLNETTDYASGATDSNGQSHVTSDGTGSTGQIEDATQSGESSGTMTNTVTGSQGHTAALLMQYRASFLNIDMLVINDLEPLFMQVWDNGDEFSNSNYGGHYHGWTFGRIGAF